LLARTWTHSIYTIKDISECTKVALELKDTNQSLEVSTFISIVISVKDFWELVLVLMSKGKDIFTEILSDTTVWDGSKKERSNDYHIMKIKMKTKRKLK